MPPRPRLPIDEVLPATIEHLRHEGANAVVLAPPGAGKTTAVPLALLEALPEGEIWVAQPRRLAARMAASLAARWSKGPLGAEVGYRVRYEGSTSDATRLIYMTEGLALRRLRERLRSAGALDPVAAIIFDEFHERHLDGDLALALAREAQRQGAKKLRVIAMSATLDPGPLEAYLEAPLFESAGRSHPVELRYEVHRNRPLEAQVQRALQSRVDEASAVDVQNFGHVLVFLPGAAEIRRCAETLEGYCRHHGLELHTLHGEAPPAQQDAAVAPSDRPKVILSTNVAETSVTIDDVATVIDTGLVRVARHDELAGVDRLELKGISRASAEQRAGRAGRTRPGVCIRLYAAADHDRRPARDVPEVLRADLSEACFDLAAAEAGDPLRFPWFEAPPAESLGAALSLLERLGAVESHRLSAHGQRMRRWPLHPRLASFFAECEALNDDKLARVALDVAALLSERELRRLDREPAHHDVADPIYELEQIDRAKGGENQLRREGFDPRGMAALRRARQSLQRRRNGSRDGSRDGSRPLSPKDNARLRRALMHAFPDRVAQVRARDERLEAKMVDGGAIPLAPGCVVREHEWIVVLRASARSEGARTRTQVTAASAIEADWILDDFLEQIDERQSVDFQRGRVRRVAELRYGALVLDRSELAGTDAATAERLFREALAAGWGKLIDLESLEALRARADFARARGLALEPLDDGVLESTLRELCEGRSSLEDLRAADLLALLRSRWSTVGGQGDALAALTRFAPDEVRLPSGRRLAVSYAPGQDPSVASFLQDFFGSDDGPRIADGKLPLVLHLRAPNRRDVQVTTDLAGFWDRHYPELRRALMRRYPRHDWPEDPRSAEPPKPRTGPRRPRGKR